MSEDDKSPFSFTLFLPPLTHRVIITVCEPVVLLAAYTKHAHFAHPTSQTFSEVIPFSQTQSLPLVRSRTLTSRSSEMHNVQIVDIADEEVQPPRRPRFTTFEKRRSGGFGLSEDDLLSTQDEGHDNDITLAIDSVFRPRRRTPPAQAESVSSVAAVSVRSARSSVAPTAEHKLVESGRATRFGKSSSPELGHPDAIEADVVNLVDEIEGKSHRVETSRLPSPNSPEERRRSRSASRQSTGGAKIVNQIQPKQRRKSTLDDDSLYWSDASAVVEPPVGLFSRPIHSAQTIDLSDDDDNDVFEHPGSQLPSPVISASASEEPEPAPASRYVPLECYDALQDFATGDAEDLEAAPVRASTPVREDFDLPATSPLSKSLAAFLDEADVQDRLLRDAETRSPPLSQALPSSPLSKSLAAFVDDSEEHDRLIRDAETRSPASSQDPASDVAEPEADDEETLDKNDIQFLGSTSRTSEKRKSSPSTSISSRTTPSSRPPRSTSTIEDDDVWSLSFPRSAGKAKVDPPSPFLAASYDDEDELSDLASLSELDVSDIEADETDPDLDEVDLDLDTSVADDVDSGEESGEVDEHDGIGAEEERWEDGVSEMLVEVETVSFVEEATQAVADEAMDTLAVVFKRKPGGEEVEEKVEQEVVQKGSVQTEKVPVDLGGAFPSPSLPVSLSFADRPRLRTDDGYAAEREVMRQFLEKGRRSSGQSSSLSSFPSLPNSD